MWVAKKECLREAGEAVASIAPVDALAETGAADLGNLIAGLGGEKI